MYSKKGKQNFHWENQEAYLENLGRSERDSRIPSVQRGEVKVFEAEKKEHWKSV